MAYDRVADLDHFVREYLPPLGLGQAQCRQRLIDTLAGRMPRGLRPRHCWRSYATVMADRYQFVDPPTARFGRLLDQALIYAEVGNDFLCLYSLEQALRVARRHLSAATVASTQHFIEVFGGRPVATQR